MRVRTGTLCFGGGSICSVPMLNFRSSDFPEAFAICSVSDALSPHPSITVWKRVSAVALLAVLARYWLARGLWWNNNLRIFPTVNHWSSKSTGSFHVSQLSDAD